MTYKVSVAIGTWNRFEMVCQAIDGALNQTYPIHEVVVYDDCSPDDSYNRLKSRYANNPKVKIFLQPKNTGGVPNWNAAINASEGDLIAWCSDDDRFFPWHIAKAIEFFEKKPSAEIFQAGILLYNDDGSPFDEEVIQSELLKGTNVQLKSKFELNTSGINFFKFIINNFSGHIQPSTLVFRRNVWEMGGQFDSEYELADSKWLIDVSQKCQLYYLPYIGALVRRHENNWSNKMGSINMQKEFNQMIIKKLKDRKSFDKSITLKFLNFKWKIVFFILLLRIFISRSRAGIFNVAEETLNYSCETYFINNNLISNKTFMKLGMKLSKLLFKIEMKIFGTNSKYIKEKEYYPK